MRSGVYPIAHRNERLFQVVVRRAAGDTNARTVRNPDDREPVSRIVAERRRSCAGPRPCAQRDRRHPVNVLSLDYGRKGRLMASAIATTSIAPERHSPIRNAAGLDAITAVGPRIAASMPNLIGASGRGRQLLGRLEDVGLLVVLALAFL